MNIKTLGSCKFTSPFTYSVCNEDEDIGFINDDKMVLSVVDKESIKKACLESQDIQAFQKAGPREKLYFEPGNTVCAIVTCGGLCPGLNAVIRHLVTMNYYRYSNKKILGIRFGYNGLSMKSKIEPFEMTPDSVREIVDEGGTILGSSRGAPEVPEMVDRLVELGVNVLYVIGGDGTQKGALKIIQEIEKRALKIGVIGIPKTIDNDIEIIDKSFGFETAFSKACEAINAGAIEAKASLNGVSIIKLMGRDSGFIAANATLAAGQVNLCLVPEIDFDIDGDSGICAYVQKRLEKRGYCVVVVAEGAGQRYFENQEVKLDASGNKKLDDIGLFLKEQIKSYLDKNGIKSSIKYIDPSYIIRSCPPTPNDMIFCSQMAQMAVHAAMAGKTGMVVGLVHNHYVHIPMELATQQRKRIDFHSQLWHSLLEATGQPNYLKNSCEA